MAEDEEEMLKAETLNPCLRALAGKTATGSPKGTQAARIAARETAVGSHKVAR